MRSLNLDLAMNCIPRSQPLSYLGIKGEHSTHVYEVDLISSENKPEEKMASQIVMESIPEQRPVKVKFLPSLPKEERSP